MKVSEKLVNEWKTLKEKGDNGELAKLLRITTQNVSKITRTGEGSLAQIKVITRYFNKKKKEMAEYTDDNN